jgi:triosephosphate isomerase
MRRPIVAANWKMNKTIGDGVDLADEVKRGLADLDSADIVLCPPFTALKSVGDLLRYGNIKLGAQNVHFEAEGAFTGEISVAMLQDLGCEYVILGHSERRLYFGETDELVNRKARAVLAAGMHPIICVGETLEQREADETESVVRGQIKASLKGLGEGLKQAVIAYEPVWAIGTGRTASPEQAQQVHAFIRSLIGAIAGKKLAAGIRIQYGGSCKPDNAKTLFALPDVDGGLIGGAALKAQPFMQILQATLPAS